MEPVMSEQELRSRIVNAILDSESWQPGEGIDSDSAVDIAFAEIGKMHVLVERERWERVLFTASEGLACITKRDGPAMVPFAAVHLRPGDLDAFEEAGE
jgi:hypothetical protein